MNQFRVLPCNFKDVMLFYYLLLTIVLNKSLLSSTFLS
jgi:hypothetical protein